MTELIKQNTDFSVKHETPSLRAEGSCRTTKEDQIESVNLSFYSEDLFVGSSSFYNSMESDSYSYSISDESKRDEIMTLNIQILDDIKTQLMPK